MAVWNTTTALTSPAVSGVELEKTTLDLWHEFLEGWFAGVSRSLNGANIVFPIAELPFQQGVGNQPKEGVAISLTWLRQSKAKRRINSDGKRYAFLKASWTLWIKAKGHNQGQGGPEVMVRRAADLLYGVLINRNATLWLSRKGINKIEPSSHSLVPSTDYFARSMVVSAELRFLSEQ